MIEDTIDMLIDTYCPEDKHYEYWDLKELNNALYGIFAVRAEGIEEIAGIEALREKLRESVLEAYQKKEEEVGPELLRYIERIIMLQVVDNQWKDHLLAMDHLKEGIGLRGYGQKDPLVEYKREAYEMFAEMTERIKSEVLTRVFKVQVRSEEEAEKISRKSRRPVVYNRGNGESQRPVKKSKKIGRNEPCPCGSGKKYKKCCGVNV